jgi:hypothetical protein
MKTIEINPDTVQVPNPFPKQSPDESFFDYLSSTVPSDAEESAAVFFYSLCEATRAGKHDKVRYLVEVEKVSTLTCSYLNVGSVKSTRCLG